MYVDSKYPSPSEAPLQALVEPLLLAHKVDVALWGHHHSYAGRLFFKKNNRDGASLCKKKTARRYHRSCPMRAGGQCVGAGTDSEDWGVVHAVVGAAGYAFSPVATGADVPKWVRFASDSTYGYARLSANSSSFHFGFVRSDNGELLDEFTLSKQV